MIAPFKQKAFKKWLAGIILLLAASVITIACLTIHSLNRPVKGSPSLVALTYPTNDDAAFDPTPVRIRDNFISFDYPQAFQRDAAGSSSGQDLTSYHYKYFAVNTWLLSVSVERLPSPNLISDSGYLYRTLHPEKYNLSSQTVNGQTYVIAADTSQSGFNQVAYSVHNGSQVAIIALNGYEPGGNYHLNATFNMVLDSFRWN